MYMPAYTRSLNLHDGVAIAAQGPRMNGARLRRRNRSPGACATTRDVSREHCRAVFDQPAVGIGYASPDGEFLAVNDKLCEMLGYTREELLKLSTASVTHPDEYDDTIADNWRLLRGEVTSYTREKRLEQP